MWVSVPLKAEAGEAYSEGRLAPVMIEDVRIPLQFKPIQAAKLVDWDGDSSRSEFQWLVQGIARIVGSEPTPVAAPSPAEPVMQAPVEPTPPPPPVIEPVEDDYPMPPGLSMYSRQLLQFLPGIYHTDFMSRFLAVFESILMPIEWNIDNFDLYLDPGSAPSGN